MFEEQPKEEDINQHAEESFEKYFESIVEAEECKNEKLEQIGEAYATVHKIYNKEEDEEYIKGNRRLARERRERGTQ